MVESFKENSGFRDGKKGLKQVGDIQCSAFSWLITHEKFPPTKFTYLEYNPAHDRLCDIGLRMNTREKAYCTWGYRQNQDGTMGDVLDCEVEANNARDKYPVAVIKDGRIVDH